jgi:hypothetical protein
MRRPIGWSAGLIVSALTVNISCSDAPAAPDAASPQSAATDEGRRGPEIPFSTLKLFFEFNSTDNDLGVQLLLDAEDWKRVTGFDPGNKQIVEILASGRLGELGITELFFESAEPEPAEVLALFPAGTYRFEGRTVDKETLVGRTTLSHTLPPAPVFSPSHSELVDRNNAVITWTAIPGSAAYQVIVENDDLDTSLTMDILPPATSVQIPAAYLRPNLVYKVEVLAISTNNNRTLTEGTFVTKP